MKIYSPTSIAEAIDLLDTYREDASILAGGTDFVVKYKEGLLHYKIACNIDRIDELRLIRECNDSLMIGPLATHQDLIDSPLINKYIPVLAQGCKTVGSPQIKNRGTIGGNMGTASPAGDTLPPLMALGADIKIISKQGERIVNSRDFFIGPGKTILKPYEMIKEIIVPKMKDDEKAFYTKLGMRNALAISIAGVAAKVKLKEDEFEKVEVALGSVGPKVLYKRITYLEGEKFDKEKLWRSVQRIKDEISPITDVRATAEYRKEMIVSLLYEGLKNMINL